MKQVILPFLRPNLSVLIISLCFVMLFIAMFTASSTHAIRLDSQHNELMRTSDQPQTLIAVLTLTVNTLGDTADNNVGDGLCDTEVIAGDQCTLRAAIQETNFATTDDVINFGLPAGSTITLLNALDTLQGNLVINGPGANTLTIQRSTASGTPDFRIFYILPNRTVNIAGLTISNGRSTSPSGAGGGIFNDHATVTLTLMMISGNSADLGGAVAISRGGGNATLTITNSTLSGNTAVNGGAIHNEGSSGNSGNLTIINSTISDNNASNMGGGIYSDATLTTTNSTITSNRADSDGTLGGNGGGLALFNTGVKTLRNTIVAGNFRGSGTTMADDIFGTLNTSTDSSNNLIGTGGSGGLGISNGNLIGVSKPGIGPLANNGGPTPTHALLPGSPAIDKGNNSFATADGLTTDQRGAGFSRIVNGGGELIATVDIGAFEAQSVLPALNLTVNTLGDAADTTLDGNCDTDNATAGSQCTLRAAIQETNYILTVDMIGFSLPASSTITLTSALPDIDGGLFITGPASGVTVSGNNLYRVFKVLAGQYLNISNLTIANGQSDQGGGICNLGNLDINSSTFRGNSAGNGGAIFTEGVNQGPFLNVINSTISGNSASVGGGLATKGHTSVTLVNVTITNNSGGQGGGIGHAAYVNLTLRNTIVFGNVGSPGTPNDLVAGTLFGGNIGGTVDRGSNNNLIGVSSGGLIHGENNNQVGVGDARLGALASNGGPTRTHALLSGSTALDAGDNSVSPGTDQRGFPRKADGPDVNTTQTVDIGAYEADPSVEDIAVKSTNEDVALMFIFNVGDAVTPFTNIVASSSNQTLVPDSNVVVGPDTPSSRTLSLTPLPNQFGTAIITVTVTRGGQSMSDTFTLMVNPVSDTPSVTNASTNANTQTTSGLVISRNPVDGAEVTHFKITAITGGTLFKNNGTSVINNGDFITFAEGNAGLKFTPTGLNGTFKIQASVSASDEGLGGGTATASITVNSGIIRFSAAHYVVAEGAGFAVITVERTGDTTGSATVDYASSDHSNPAEFIPCTSPGSGLASSRCDFTTAMGTLRFAAGETSKTFNVLITQDNYVEGTETLDLTLSRLTGNVVFGVPQTAILSIAGDATEPATNPIDTSIEFVLSQYHDFLQREPDGPGLAFWTDNIEKCNDPARRPAGQTPAQCIDKQRESTAVAFFMSPEFQITGGFVYRLYKGSLTGVPNYDGGSPGRFPTSLEFMRDVSQVSEGIVVNNQISGAVVEANRNRLAAEFVLRPEFVAKYGGLNNTLYVQELFNTTIIAATAGERQALVEGLNNGAETRASVLRKVVDGTVVISEGNVLFTTTYGQAFYNQEFRRVFVFMEYIGYLRRNPDAAGFIFWLGKLNFYNGDPFQAEMVRSFILSPEYRSRFGQP